MKKRSTLADVAAAAGVSKMTASRALRKAGDVSARSQEKVDRAARALDYVGNHLATALSSRQASLIGVVVPSLSNVVFAEVLSGIVEALEGSGLQPVFGVTQYDPVQEYETIRNMLSWAPAGLIVTGLDQPEETQRLLAQAEVPIVQIMDLDGVPVDAVVGLSHRQAGEAMAHELVKRGCRRFGYVGCDLDKDTRAAKRKAGFEAILAQHGMQFEGMEVLEGRSNVKRGRASTAKLLERHSGFDCIYYSNDDLAAGGAFHCMASNIAVPDDLVLAGFNGLDLIDSLPVRVLTSHTPRREIGISAARYVLGSQDKLSDGPGGYHAFTSNISFKGG